MKTVYVSIGNSDDKLASLAKAYDQDSIAWTEVPKTEFLCAAG